MIFYKNIIYNKMNKCLYLGKQANSQKINLDISENKSLMINTHTRNLTAIQSEIENKSEIQYPGWYINYLKCS